MHEDQCGRSQLLTIRSKMCVYCVCARVRISFSLCFLSSHSQKWDANSWNVERSEDKEAEGEEWRKENRQSPNVSSRSDVVLVIWTGNLFGLVWSIDFATSYISKAQCATKMMMLSSYFCSSSFLLFFFFFCFLHSLKWAIAWIICAHCTTRGFFVAIIMQTYLVSYEQEWEKMKRMLIYLKVQSVPRVRQAKIKKEKRQTSERKKKPAHREPNYRITKCSTEEKKKGRAGMKKKNKVKSGGNGHKIEWERRIKMFNKRNHTAHTTHNTHSAH